MEKEERTPDVVTLLKRILESSDLEGVRNLPIVKTKEVGHDADSKMIIIGGKVSLNKN